METDVNELVSRDVEDNHFLRQDSTTSQGLPRPIAVAFSRLAGISRLSFFRVPPTS